MTRTSLRSRLLTTTAVLSVVLASMTPARLPAQETAPAEVPPAAAPTQTTPSEAEAPAPEEAAPEAPQAVTPDVKVQEPEPEPAPAPAEPQTREAPAADTNDAPEVETPAPRTPRSAEPETPAEAAPDKVAPRANEAPEGRDTNAAGSEEAEPETTDRATDPAEPEATESDAPPARSSAEPEAPAARETVATPETPPANTAQGDDAEAVDTLNSLLGEDDAAPVAAAAAAAASGDEPLNNATVTEVTEENARSSDEDFRTSASGEERANKDDDDDDDDDGGLSNLQKVGLLALGGLAVGALMNNGDEVVSNTGDRVVLRQNDGSYQVLKDDDALLRQPGSTVRTENYADGSTRSIVEQADGSRIETIRDASGRVLRRARIDTDGRQTLLIDDTRQAAPVDLSLLPRSREDVRVSATDRTSLREALERIETRDNARLYSLSQIRDYREVRALAPVVDVDNITFRTGSAAVEASQAEELADLGNLMRDLIDERPGEVFLIEGHTDAVGSAASNLALSDRRAESVALALTEYFDVPPENMVVQGYGESDLRVDAEGDEPRNRRVAVRIITPVLQVAQSR